MTIEELRKYYEDSLDELRKEVIKKIKQPCIESPCTHEERCLYEEAENE